MAGNIQEYVDSRADILRQTSQTAERFSTAWYKEALVLPYRRTAVSEAIHGMGRPYNVVDSTFESPRRVLTHRAFLVSPFRRGLLRWTDPIYGLSFSEQQPDDAECVSAKLEITSMGNGEIEVYALARDRMEMHWQSFKLPTLTDLKNRLDNGFLRGVTEVLGLDPLIFQIR